MGDLSHTQLLSSSSSGTKFRDGNGAKYQQFQYDDTVVLEEPLFGTQLENIHVATEVLDSPDCIENMTTGKADKYEEEVVPDSDNEAICETEVISVAKGLSSDIIGGTVEGQPIATVSEQCSVGCSQRLFRSVHSHLLEAGSGLSAHSMNFEGNDSWPDSAQTEIKSQKQFALGDDRISGVKDQFSVDQDHDYLDCNGELMGNMEGSRSWDCKSNVKKMFCSDALDENQDSSGNFESSEGGKDLPQLPAYDHEFTRISNTESQEPGESSQANVLRFVDQFLSVSNMNLSEEVEPRKTIRDKSPPVSSAKGPQSLAKRLHLRNTAGERGIFEWVDSRDDQRVGNLSGRKMDSFFDCRGLGQGSVTRPKKTVDFYDKEGSDFGNECTEKKGPSNVHEETMYSTHLNSRFMVHNAKDTELEKQLAAETTRQQLEACDIGRDALDIFDIGLGTQIAAEAMEALSNALPARCNAADVHQGPQSTFEDLPKGVTKKESCLEHHPFRTRAYHDSGDIAKHLKQRKRPTEKLSRETSTLFLKHSKNQGLAIKPKVKRGKSVAEKHLPSRYAAHASERSGRGSSKHTEQRKTEEVVDSDNIKVVDKFISPSILIEQISPGKAQSQGESKSFSPIAHRTRQRMSVSASGRINNSSNSSGEGTNDIIEVNVHKNKSKKSDLNTDEFEVLGIRQKSFKARFNTSGETRNSKPGLRQQTGVKAAALKLDIWIYPRRKRTHRTVPGHSYRTSNLHTLFTVDGVEENGHHIRNPKRLKYSSKTTSFNLEMKRKAQSSESNSEESFFKQKLDEPGSAVDVFNYDAAVLNKKMFTMKMFGAKASTQSSKLDEADSVSPDDGGKKYHEFGASSEKMVESSVSECITTVNSCKVIAGPSPIYMGCDYHKQPCKKNLPKSSLIKELISLGIPKSIPRFTSKDLRRRRNMANVRVLFSQNLDEDIIKQQKKILAQMGISIASSSFDATHFIADKFVRTRNMLEIIALGKPVVTHLWLESCRQASCLLDEKNYILRDAKKEKEIGFSMPFSLTRASLHPLLKGHSVFMTANIKPAKDMIASLVKAAHGWVVERIQISAIEEENISDDLLILSCEEDYAICVPYMQKGAAVYSSELLLNGIVIQKLEYERHQLFANHSRTHYSSVWSKGNGNQSRLITNCT